MKLEARGQQRSLEHWVLQIGRQNLPSPKPKLKRLGDRILGCLPKDGRPNPGIFLTSPLLLDLAIGEAQLLGKLTYKKQTGELKGRFAWGKRGKHVCLSYPKPV